MSRHDNQTPVKNIPILSRDVQRWLYENDRSRYVGYAPGYTGQPLPNHRGIIEGGK